MDCLKPPETGINVLSGLAQPPSRGAPLNNLNQVWLKMTQSLNKGDVMVCGGDFIQASEGCFLTKATTGDVGYLTVTADTAASWNVNPDSNTVCTSKQDLYNCTNGDDGKGGKLSQCICPCPAGKMKYPPDSDDYDLLQASIDAMKRGAKIVFLDDGNFLAGVYPDNKKNRDYESLILQKASNDLPAGSGGGFYWYFYAPPYAGGIMTHAKVCTTFHDLQSSKPWMSTILGSFNPSYPISLTFEMATVAVGYLKNPVMEMFGYVVFDIMTNIVNFQYSTKNSNYKSYMTGAVWDKTKGGGAAQGACHSNYNSQYSNYCTISPASSGDAQGFMQPWYNIGQALGVTITPGKGATWWSNLADGPWKDSSTGPIFGEKTYFQDGDIKTDVHFCGLKFCGPGINSYGETDEQRVVFTDKDVVVRVGMTPTQRFPRFNYGLQLINELLANTKKYLKVGIMTSFADYPGGYNPDPTDPTASPVMDPDWVLGPVNNLPQRNGYSQKDVTTGQMLTLVHKGLPMYVMQKPQSSVTKKVPCAFECKDGTCSVSSVKEGPFQDPTTYEPTNDCYTIHGAVKTGTCTTPGTYGLNKTQDLGNWNISSTCGSPGSDTEAACVCTKTSTGAPRTPGVWTPSTATMQPSCFDSLTSCKKVCGGDTKEGYTKTRCSSYDDAKWISAKSRTWENGAIPGSTGMLVNWLHGRAWIGDYYKRSDFEKGMNPAEGPMSNLENGTLASVSATNPYPIFYRWYKSGFHWKFYMNERSMIFSTQHPTKYFYSDSLTVTPMGYDIRWSNCPGMIAYYDQIFNYIWKFDTIQLDGVDPAYPKSGGICFGAPQPSTSPQNDCAAGLYFSKNPYLPPLCSDGAGKSCCDVPGASNLDGACYPGGQGKVKGSGFKCVTNNGKYYCDVDNTANPQYKTKEECLKACKKGGGGGHGGGGHGGGWSTGKKVLVGVGATLALILIVVGLLIILRPQMFKRM